MPIGFVSAPATAILLRLPGEEKNLLEYLRSLAENQTETSDFQTFMELHVSMKRVRPGKGEVSVALDKNDPNAMAITMTEEQIRDIYPWDYGVLTQRLQARYVDFRANQKYHAVRKPLNGDQRFANLRYLDPGNPKSLKKRFYSPNIVAEFDKHYTLKDS